MDPYELEFKDRPKTLKKGSRDKPASPMVPRIKETVMLGVQRYISRFSSYRNGDVVLANVALALGFDARDVMDCLSVLESSGVVEFYQANKAASYNVRGQRVSWNGSSWVLDPEGRRSSGPFFRIRKRSSKVLNRRKKKSQKRDDENRVRALARAKPVAWDGVVFSVPYEFQEKVRETGGLSVLPTSTARRPVCKICGAEDCSGGRKGRKMERRQSMRACKERVVSQILET